MRHNPELHIALSEAQNILGRLKEHVTLGTCRGFLNEKGLYIDTCCDACCLLSEEFHKREDRAKELIDDMESGHCQECG